MEAIREQFAARRRPVVVLCLYALIVGAISFVYYLGPAIDGEAPALARSALGLLGVAGAVLAWVRWASYGISGWHLLAAWALIQIPIFAWSVDGSPTLQIIHFKLSATSHTTASGETTSYSEIGVNLVGIALALALFKWRADFTRARIAAPV
jgi:hypothetical protein